MGKGKAHKDSRRLALRWEKVPLVRTRVRKGKDWIKLSYLDNGEVVFCTKTIQTNHQVLLTLLEEFGLKSKTIDFLVEQAWLSKFVFVIRGSKEFLYNIYSCVSRNSFDSLFRPTAPRGGSPFRCFGVCPGQSQASVPGRLESSSLAFVCLPETEGCTPSRTDPQRHLASRLIHRYTHAIYYLRAAAPAADPGRMINEWNQIGINILRCVALLGFPLFHMYIFMKYIWQNILI